MHGVRGDRSRTGAQSHISLHAHKDQRQRSRDQHYRDAIPDLLDAGGIHQPFERFLEHKCSGARDDYGLGQGGQALRLSVAEPMLAIRHAHSLSKTRQAAVLTDA